MSDASELREAPEAEALDREAADDSLVPRLLRRRLPAAVAVGAVLAVAAVAGGLVVSMNQELDDVRGELRASTMAREEMSEELAAAQHDLEEARADRDDAIDAAAVAEEEARAAAEAELAPRIAEIEQREEEVAAREAAVTQAEVERDQTSFGTGVWEVGVDIQPGRYKTAGSPDCYWEKTTASGEIIDNDLPGGPTTVVIEPSVFTFSSQRCGEWTKVG